MTEKARDRQRQLLNLVAEVKARLEGNVENMTFPIPQFIVVGKQSVGKSRLIEGLAGQTFNFVSGTLGSRRPTVLEFRNDPAIKESRWSVRDDAGNWKVYPISEVMNIVGKAHESLGTTVSDIPIRVKVEGADCVDLGLVDLPGFRSYAKDAAMQELSRKIEKLVGRFMADENNVIICVEEAGDAAGFSTLAKCRELDPSYRRTILVRNKLDKYYNDLTNDNINKWLEGFGDLPPTLERFALSLPHWSATMPKSFGEMRTECAEQDVSQLMSKGAAMKYAKQIGFQNFREFMESKIQVLFAEALGPLLTKLKLLLQDHDERMLVIKTEEETINEDNILHATRSAGISFAQSFNFLMEGSLCSQTNRRTLEEELQAFNDYCDRTGALSKDERTVAAFDTLSSYVSYLRDDVQLQGMDVQLNGGAAFRRLMYEVEVFTRTAGMLAKLDPRDVMQARGSGTRGTTTWHDTITRLMLKDAPKLMVEKTRYVGERLKWFFSEQKEAVIQFMLQLKGSPEEHMFSRLYFKQATVIQRNETMKACIFKAFDNANQKNQDNFNKLWNDFMNSMFQSPLLLLKSCSMPRMGADESYSEEVAPTFESTKERIKVERFQRGHLSAVLRKRIQEIPEEDINISESLPMVKEVIEKTFSVIRCVVADQMQLYSESFFLLPMLRRLEGEMAKMELMEEDKLRYRARKEVLKEETTNINRMQNDLSWSIAAIETFKVTRSSGDA